MGRVPRGLSVEVKDRPLRPVEVLAEEDAGDGRANRRAPSCEAGAPVPLELPPGHLLYGLALPRQRHRDLHALLRRRRQHHPDLAATVVHVVNLETLLLLRRDGDHCHRARREDRLLGLPNARGRPDRALPAGVHVSLDHLLEIILVPLAPELKPRIWQADEERTGQDGVLLGAVVLELPPEAYLEHARLRQPRVALAAVSAAALARAGAAILDHDCLRRCHRGASAAAHPSTGFHKNK
mmetsp:Transcript_9074/g.26034  ORF Transcript_9074/g.26034 Transcript_9074/m.26034 type:complete len:239 (-) Transcript_9074:43-759(-)